MYNRNQTGKIYHYEGVKRQNCIDSQCQYLVHKPMLVKFRGKYVYHTTWQCLHPKCGTPRIVTTLHTCPENFISKRTVKRNP